MARILVTVAAVAAAAAITYFSSGTLGPVAASLLGAVVGAGVSYAGSSILGLNKAPKSPNTAKTGVEVASDRRQMFRSSVAPVAYVYGQARVSGPIVYASSSGEDLRYLHVVVPLAGHPIAGADAFWVNDDRVLPAKLDGNGVVTEGPLKDRVVIRLYDGTQTAADTGLVAESLDGWSANHIGRGIAYLYVRLEYNEDVFRSGLQNVGAEIRGHKELYDPRTGFTGYYDNPALAILHYLRSSDGLACSDDEIDFPSFVAAANICDEAVTIAADGTTQKRYVIGGGFTLDRVPLDVLEDMQAACAGQLVYVQGQYRLYAGAYETPTDTLTVADLAGPVELVTKPPRAELFNAVRGTFIDPEKSWQSADFPPITDSFEVEDGETIWRDIDLPMVNNRTRAIRLALLGLRRARESLTLRVPVKYSGLRFCVWQMLSVTIADFGFSAKPFRISALSFDPGSGLVTLTLREEGAQSYAWSYDAANLIGRAPDTNLVSPFSIPAPAGLAATEELYVGNVGGGVRTRARLAWVTPPHPFVSGYDVQIREASGTEWRFAAATAGERVANVDDLADGLYVVRVRARSTVAVGAWAELQVAIGALAAVPPSDVTGLAVQAIGGFAYLRWDEMPDIDVRVGGAIEFRHTPDTTSPTWAGSTSIGDAVPGGATWTILPLKAGTYLAKARDQGGRYSATAASIGAAQATALAWTSLSTLTEHSAFSGTKTDTIVAASKLKLDSGGDIDGEADFDAIPDIDGLGGVLPEGSYAFSGGIDLGSVKRVRITGNLKAAVVNTLDLIDSRAAPIDEWLSFDGLAGGEADAWIEVRTTPDNPSGSPTWSAWGRLDAAEFVCRGIQARAQLRSLDPAFNIEVSELSLTAEEVA